MSKNIFTEYILEEFNSWASEGTIFFPHFCSTGLTHHLLNCTVRCVGVFWITAAWLCPSWCTWLTELINHFFLKPVVIRLITLKSSRLVSNSETKCLVLVFTRWLTSTFLLFFSYYCTHCSYSWEDSRFWLTKHAKTSKLATIVSGITVKQTKKKD